MASTSRSDALLLAFVLASFAANSLVTRALVSRDLLEPGLGAALRFLAGALTLALLAGPRAALPTRANARPALWLGAYACLIAYGYAFIGASAGTFVFYACVLGTVLAAGGRPSARAWAGGALALAGLALLAYARPGGATLLGVGLLAATGVAWGLYTLAGRGAQDPLRASARNFVALAPAALLLAAWGAWRGPVTPWGVLLALAMGAGTTALAYVAWYRLQARLDHAQAGTYQLAVPVLTAALGVALLGEPFSWPLALAGVLVVSGMALVTRRA